MSREWRRAGSTGRVIAADPHEVYSLISDVSATGRRSEECWSAGWIDGARPAQVGARFRGHNRHGLARWSRVCEVVEADAGRVFAFRTVPERLDPSRSDSTTWRFELAPQGRGTHVTHCYEITTLPREPFRTMFGLLLPHHRDMRPALRHTLDALARELEGA